MVGLTTGFVVSNNAFLAQILASEKAETFPLSKLGVSFFTITSGAASGITGCVGATGLAVSVAVSLE